MQFGTLNCIGSICLFFFIIVHVCATYMKISLRDDPIQMYVGG